MKLDLNFSYFSRIITILMISLALFFTTIGFASGCSYQNKQLCKNLNDFSEEPNVLPLLHDLLAPESTLVDVIYKIIVTQDEMRKKKQLSHNMLIEQELIFELFESSLINQRRKNQLSEQLIKMKLEKFFVPRRNCFEQIMYHLDNLKPLVNNLSPENQELYISIRDQLQYRSACYSVLGRIKDHEVDSLTSEEVEQFNAEEQFQGIEWEDIFREIINLDIVHKHSWHDIRTSFEKVYNYFQPFFLSSARYQEIYETMLGERKEKDQFFRQQLQYNRDALKQESDDDQQMKELYEYELHILEVIKKKFIADLEPSERELVLQGAKIASSDFLENLEQNEVKKKKFDEAEKRERFGGIRSKRRKEIHEKNMNSEFKKQQDFRMQVESETILIMRKDL